MGVRSDRRRVLRVGAGPVGWRPDQVAVEAPLSLVVDGAVVATTMRTPGHDVELALGWLVGEGVLAHRDDVVAVRAGDERTVEIALAPGVEPPGPRLGLTVSACGLCGVDDLDAVAARVDAAPRPDGAATVDVDVLLSLPERLRAAQPLFDRTGGLHAAGWFSRVGEVRLVREDVGRHNALDKLVGALWERDQLPAADGVLCLSGRASYELVAKAVMAGMHVVVAVSAPSTAAVDLAREQGITLLGFVRGGGANVYAGEQRLAGVPAAQGLRALP